MVVSHDDPDLGGDDFLDDPDWIDRVLDRAVDRASGPGDPEAQEWAASTDAPVVTPASVVEEDSPVEQIQPLAATPPVASSTPAADSIAFALESEPTWAENEPTLQNPSLPSIASELQEPAPVVAAPIRSEAAVPPAPEPTSDLLGMPSWVDAESEAAAVPSEPALAEVAMGSASPTFGTQRPGRLDDGEIEGWEKLSWDDIESSRPADLGDDPAKHDSKVEPAGAVEALRSSGAGRFLVDWLPILLVAVVAAVLVRALVFQAYYIPSGSMLPTLELQDRVVVNKLSYDFHDVNRGDVIVFKRPEGGEGQAEDLIKRVIALPGETVQIRQGEVYVNSQLVVEPYLQSQGVTQPLTDLIPNCLNGGPADCTVPEDSVFVLGDNRTESQDSRFFGPISEDTIVGRAFVRIWPLNDIGRL